MHFWCNDTTLKKIFSIEKLNLVVWGDETLVGGVNWEDFSWWEGWVIFGQWGGSTSIPPKRNWGNPCEDWLTYFGETNKPEELDLFYLKLPFSDRLLSHLHPCDPCSLSLLDFLISFDPIISFTVAFPSDHVFVSFFVLFRHSQRGMLLFLACFWFVHMLIEMTLII